MLSPDVRIARLAERQCAVFSRAQALEAGFTADQIKSRLSRRLWWRVHRAIYAIGGVRLTREGLAQAATLAAPGSVASYLCAAQLWRITNVTGPIAITADRTIRLNGVIVHRDALQPSDKTVLGTVPITRPQRTLIDVASCLPEKALARAIEEARRRYRVDMSALHDRIGSMSKSGRRGLRTLTRLVESRVGLAVPESVRETDLAELLTGAGLPMPTPQHEIYDLAGAFIARPDFAYVGEKIAIEYDSYEWHLNKDSFITDRVRLNKMVALGWRPVLVTAYQADNDPAEVIRVVCDLLRA